LLITALHLLEQKRHKREEKWREGQKTASLLIWAASIAASGLTIRQKIAATTHSVWN
jgi:hypothetical protein